MSSRIAGNLVGDELWLRCPQCGDSRKHPHKAHFSVNLATGKYYCHRCNQGGTYTPQETFDLTGHWITGVISHESPEPEIASGDMMNFLYLNRRPGRGITRDSRLLRSHIRLPSKDFSRTLDLFESRDLTGAEMGIHIRASWKKLARTYGRRVFGYKGKDMITVKTIRVVEGPYDVMEDLDVCLFGLPSNDQVLALQGHSLILCPDGDIWTSSERLKRFLLPFYRMGSVVAGVERLPDDKDPDEVPPDDREMMSFGQSWAFMKQLETEEEENW